MKVVHFSNWAPNRSGLYECTKDQIKYERQEGIISDIAIFEVENPVGYNDNGLIPISWSVAKDADLFVIHRGLPADLEKLGKPIVFVIHGTAEFLMLEEVYSNADKTPFNSHINLIKNCNAAVAVNQHDYDIYKLYDDKNKMTMIHDSIDVDRYSIDGYMYPYKNHPQILWCDSLRVNKHPAHIIWAMPEILKQIPDARLSIVGLDMLSMLTWRNLILRSPGQYIASCIENIQLSTNDIQPYMRGADILFNSNISGIPSRVELEAMACGCQVVGYSDSFTQYKCKPFDVKDIADTVVRCWNDVKDKQAESRQAARCRVMEIANMEVNVRDHYIPLYEKVLNIRK